MESNSNNNNNNLCRNHYRYIMQSVFWPSEFVSYGSFSFVLSFFASFRLNNGPSVCSGHNCVIRFMFYHEMTGSKAKDWFGFDVVVLLTRHKGRCVYFRESGASSGSYFFRARGVSGLSNGAATRNMVGKESTRPLTTFFPSQHAFNWQKMHSIGALGYWVWVRIGDDGLFTTRVWKILIETERYGGTTPVLRC